MPRELDYTPTADQLDRIVTDEVGFAVHPAQVDNSRPPVRLWDTVQQQWTNPLPYDMIALKVREVGFRCLYCPYSSQRKGDVTSHHRIATEKYRDHQDAEIHTGSAGTENFFYCTACGSKNPNRSKVVNHIQNCLDIPYHGPAFELCVRRFTLSPEGR